jgi:cytochrome c oxidase cbb3-type subunit III
VLALAVVVAVVAASCTTGEGGGPKPTDPALAQGWQVYRDHCATCHGGTGGGGSGPKLAGTVAKRFPDIADQISVIADGKSGGMPAWKDTLSSTQIRDVANYERRCLGAPSC